MQFEHAASIVRNSAWLAGLSQHLQDALVAKLRLRKLKKGDFVYRIGDEALDIFFLADGVLTSSIEHPIHGLITGAVLQTGDWFGQSGCLGAHRRLANMQAREPAVLLCLSREAVGDLMKSDHRWPWAFFELFSASYIMEFMREVDLLISDKRLRLYSRLLTLAGRQGHHQEARPTRLGWSKEELALISGTSRQSVHEILNELVKDGICQLGYREITLLDPAALKKRFDAEATELAEKEP
jgi:CRP-like cAMP-binding protein